MGKSSSSYVSIAKRIEEKIVNSGMDEENKISYLQYMFDFTDREIHILLLGATGAGKSSTINAVFNMELASVGVGVDPETKVIKRYELGNLVLWDSPGLGDGIKSDQRYMKTIISKLHEKNEEGELLINAVFLIIDISVRDMGTTYDFLTDVIIPHVPDTKMILVGLNQADRAMKGRYWDNENKLPKRELVEFLEKKAESVRRRIKDNCGIDIETVYYSAGYKEPGKPQEKPYNVSKLLFYLLSVIPASTGEEEWVQDTDNEMIETFGELFESLGKFDRILENFRENPDDNMEDEQ